MPTVKITIMRINQSKLTFYVKPSPNELTHAYLLDAINDRYTPNGNCLESTFSLFWIGKTSLIQFFYNI